MDEAIKARLVEAAQAGGKIHSHPFTPYLCSSHHFFPLSTNSELLLQSFLSYVCLTTSITVYDKLYRLVFYLCTLSSSPFMSNMTFI